jgi:predicted dehydrogenase
MSHHPSRRHFLHTAALGLSSLTTGSFAQEKSSPNEKLHVGVIGVAGQGAYNLGSVAAAGTEVVALCDVDEKRAGKAREQFPQAKFYADFRKLIDQKGIDAVVVATPDHTHAIATALALKAGLHTYCEKPLTHTVHEARFIAELAAKQKRVTQMGTQIHAGNNYRRVVEIIQSGAIGPVKEAHVWCAKSWGGGDRPKDTPPVPEGLHYDLWLGPAPERPYHPAYVPFNWRKYWDFGGGTLADMACHYMDLPFWALKLRHPEKVSAEGPAPNPETAAVSLVVTYQFPARDTLPPVKLVWYDGGKRPTEYAEKSGGAIAKWGDGVMFVGEKGMLLANYDKWKLLPEKDFEGFTPPAPSIPNSIGHHKEWVQACKSGGATTCNFDYSGALTETVLLGNVAYRLGKPIVWDAKNLKATGEPEADKLIHKEYRKPWSL